MIDEEMLRKILYYMTIIILVGFLFILLIEYNIINRIEKLEQQYSSLDCTCYCETCNCCERRNVQHE